MVLKLKKKNKYIGIDNEFDDYQLDGQENDGLLELASMLAHLVKEDNETIYHFEGKRYDVGDKFGFIKATIDFSLDREDLHDQVNEYVHTLVK